MRMKFSLLVLLICAEAIALPPVRVRLREHYESHNVHFESLGVDSASYSGFSNTANIWFETPFLESFGLSASPVLGSSALSSASSQAPGTDLNIRIWRIALEYKKFFAPSEPGGGAFGRVGLGLGILETRGAAGSYVGMSFSSGIGYEVLFGRIGVAPEVGISPAFLSGGNSVITSMITLGVHFYLFGEDLPGDSPH